MTYLALQSLTEVLALSAKIHSAILSIYELDPAWSQDFASVSGVPANECPCGEALAVFTVQPAEPGVRKKGTEARRHGGTEGE